ncbi:MAG: serine/threonine-protein kinase [Pirellulales bacterium]
MAKSRIGPFALESPLAPATKSGQMFRGFHVDQKKLAAIRVFPIPLGMTPESRQAFADQLEQLKSLRHVGIVRCYGGGFDTRNAFLAYELVDGESLDKVLQRRGRLTWETTIDYAKQLGEALLHAQQFAWAHGRLQPSKILVTPEGLLKIADWRRDEVSAMLNSPVTAEQMQMTAPEMLEGQVASEKSDLYSLGAIMFSMLTGSPPFSATDPATLTVQIRQTTAVNAASIALDCPVWLSSIVDQLLSKDPMRRPFSIAAFLLALREAERRQMEGVGVLQHATSGFSPLQMNVDRQEAERVLGIKQKKEKVAREHSIFESTWILILGLFLAVGAIVWFMLPPSEAALRQKAEKSLASEKTSDWNYARDRYLEPMLERFPEGEHAGWAREKLNWLKARETERKINREENGKQAGWSQAYSRFAEARNFERFGDNVTALEKYKSIQKLFADEVDSQSVVYLAGEGIARITAAGNTNSLQALLTKKLEQANEAYERAEITKAKELWESIINLYKGNEQVAEIVAAAQERLDDVNAKSKNK